MDEWRQNFLASSPMFEPLCGVGACVETHTDWPALDAYNALLDPGITSLNGARLKFAPQSPKPVSLEDKYEARIYLRGEVQTRTENWHDLFNALVWLAFPLTKATLNARHYEAIVQSTHSANRGKTRDALTLFDESGIVVLYSEDELAGLLKGFEWKALFHARRQDVLKHMRFVIFGHSLYEKALNPYIGFTGKGLLLRVEQALIDKLSTGQASALDSMLAARFAPDNTIAAQDFTPVPLLGIPGWWKANESGEFYDNSGYFRPAPKKNL